MNNISFRVLFSAVSISAIGSQITIVALPLTAILTLQATPLEMGILTGAGTLPGIVFGLFFGILIERLPKKRIMVGTNLASAITLALVPISHSTYALTFALLVGVNFVASSVASAQGIAMLSFLRAIVDKDSLVVANSQLSGVRSITQVIGPAIAGLLIARYSAPGAIAFDAASFFFAMTLISLLTEIEPSESHNQKVESVAERIGVGVAFVKSNSELRRFVMTAAGLNLFAAAFGSVQALFIVRHFGVPPSSYGVALGIGGFGSIVGATVASRISQKLDLNVILAITVALFVVADATVCSLHGKTPDIIIVFSGCRILNSFAAVIVGIHLVTYVQKLTPIDILSRVSGTVMTAMAATLPVGAFLGGLLGNFIGIRQTLIVATVGYGVVFFVVLTRVLVR